ncbi:hypothetical protein E8E15_000679 [Penicillium rubens]|nr:hypothetical protein E8E15_000679 [Penicillium rubens]
MFRSLLAVIAVLGQVQAFKPGPLIQSTCDALSTWHQAMGGSWSATLSSSEPTQTVSLSLDCEVEMERALTRCVSGPYIDCNSIVISLDGQISRMAMSKQHQKGELVMGLSLNSSSASQSPFSRESADLLGSSRGHLEAVRLLVQQGERLQINRGTMTAHDTALCIAARDGNSELVLALLRRDQTDQNQPFQAPLSLAA